MRVIGRFLKRRARDALLITAWLVVLFNTVQLTRLEGESAERMVASYAAMLTLGLAATWLWARARSRER